VESWEPNETAPTLEQGDDEEGSKEGDETVSMEDAVFPLPEKIKTFKSWIVCFHSENLMG